MARRCDKAFKEQAIQMVIELHQPVAEVARDFGVPDTTLHQWLKNAREHPWEPHVGSGHLREADQAARELQRRIRDLEEENAILKKRCASSPTTTGSKICVHS
ncbi:transposase [Sulfobacillus harzensis]|uniref:Transposase n=1 Tax=Sulfobacillus harzensis TaxID=2729629 RepID=A0A7Y0L553_9FIRM|nr:transposase [Sulfobacillus harzensis]NMP22059.1 transposase [Sulfobacillus harzensis]